MSEDGENRGIQADADEACHLPKQRQGPLAP
jgi:hypothetical protein